MKLKVWLAKSLVNPFGDEIRTFPDDYEYVATINVADEEEGFYATQNLTEECWLTGPKVEKRVKKGVRSFSVGDVFEQEDGKIRVAEMIGFNNGTESILINRINNGTQEEKSL
jgi:hypothetical protein